MKFKKGDRVKCNRGYTFDPAEGIIAEVGKGAIIVQITKGMDDNYGDRKKNRWDYSDCELTLINRNKETTMKDAKFGIKFERDEDPVEFFETKKQAEKRISELLDDEDVKKNEIYLFEIKGIWQVNRPITYELIELIKGRKTKKTKVNLKNKMRKNEKERN